MKKTKKVCLTVNRLFHAMNITEKDCYPSCQGMDKEGKCDQMIIKEIEEREEK